MSQPVSYVEFNSPDLETTNVFLSILDRTGPLIGLHAYDVST